MCRCVCDRVTVPESPQLCYIHSHLGTAHRFGLSQGGHKMFQQHIQFNSIFVNFQPTCSPPARRTLLCPGLPWPIHPTQLRTPSVLPLSILPVASTPSHNDGAHDHTCCPCPWLMPLQVSCLCLLSCRCPFTHRTSLGCFAFLAGPAAGPAAGSAAGPEPRLQQLRQRASAPGRQLRWPRRAWGARRWPGRP